MVSLGLLVATGLCATPAAAQAPGHCGGASEACWESFHFTTDATRHARVDSAGGIGTGYSFSLDYDPEDGNSEDFCPHCRLTILTADPGIDLDVLRQVGIERSQITSASGMLTRLQSVVAADPTGLAMELNEGIMGAELEAVVEEIEAIQERVALIVTALETFERLQSLSFDWGSASIDDLIEALSLRMDTAFRADFSNPNDPRRYNSGARVYTIPEFVAGLPAGDQAVVQSALGSIPGLTGGLEISGDDDNPLDPVRFHGIHTDLTVRQRTYTVNGTSAYLIVYTLVNETSRVFPFVEVAQMADVDIPPLSSDTATAFDPAFQAALVYDTIPYTDPEEHYWFGVAPATLAGAPGGFVFANYNLDEIYSLAQHGSSTTQADRHRWMLWDPALSGDQDDADGKSEKQVAVSMVLAGPMLPGDQRSVAFCYAGGEGQSSASARAATTAALAACQAMYTGVTPMCGNNVRELGEECDEVSDSCTPACQRLVCGDGRLFAPEECDDGNTEDGDGCSSTCAREVCGNGVSQFGEECDDGNLSNADACTTECEVATCGDGYLRSAPACAPGAPCGCAGYEYCLSGSFTIATHTVSPSMFDDLDGVRVDFRMGFDAASVTSVPGPAGLSNLQVTTGPVHIEMTGDPQVEEIAVGLEGRETRIEIRSSTLTGGNTISVSRMVTRGGIGFALGSITGTIVRVDRDGDGVPVLGTARFSNANAELSYLVGTLVDRATGRADGSVRVPPAANAPGELCDDGNASNFDDCTDACEPARCGDGYVQPGRGEECDEGLASSAWCQSDCTLTPVAAAACGDGSDPLDPGEGCDDGNTIDGDGCSALCQPETCGDGVVQASRGEECDDGMNGDGDGCTDACIIEFCGDGILQPDEDCDTGARVSDTANCLSTCEVARCGDGFVEAGVEACDDGNLVGGDGCTAACLVEVCGDGVPGPGEECDDGNTTERDGCTPDCRYEICGDARPGPNEQCDDGNLANGDGCDKDCRLENAMACGDGTVGRGEQCDDGGRESGDGCDEFCQLDDPDACGDGVLGAGEQCDDGNQLPGDGCGARCTEERCGDGIQVQGESCDDGNDDDEDGCSADCLAEPSECGDGLHEYGEQCDDGNEDDTDSCTSECRINPPGSAPLIDTCNDGDLDFGEQCDDGNRNEGDGCDATCQREATVCGNGRLEYGERCDDGGYLEGDGCSATCQIEGEEVPVPMTRRGCRCSVPSGASSPTPWLLATLGLGLLIRRRRRQR